MRKLSLSLVVLVLLAGCGRSEAPTKTTSTPPPSPPAAQPPPSPPAALPPAAAPAPNAPAAAAPLRVASIDLGTAVGADKRITNPTRAFAPADTIYASVATEGGAAAAVNLKAKWTYGEGADAQVVTEQNQPVTTGAPSVTEFHIAKGSGWPTGRYQVEVLADNKVLGAQQFEVR